MEKPHFKMVKIGNVKLKNIQIIMKMKHYLTKKYRNVILKLNVIKNVKKSIIKLFHIL